MKKIARLVVVTTSIAILAMFNVATAETNTVSETNDAPVLTGIGGPDQFGYRWVDSDQAWGPEYEWIDISEVGTRLTAMDGDWGNYYALYGPYDIGFDFPYYGNTYSEVRIARHGYITFQDVDESKYVVQHIMDDYTGRDIPNNFISMLWTDLKPYTTTLISPDETDTTTYNRPVYYYHDEENDRFIISYYHTSYQRSASHGNVGNPVSDVTFQVILYADGRIVMQYDVMDDTGCDEIDWDVHDNHRTICTYNNETVVIGIENAAGDDGLEVAFCEPYIHDSLAILYYPGSIYDYDIAPLTFVSPLEPWQATNPFISEITFENQGALSASFDVNLFISYDGSVVYNETQNVSNLESLTSINIVFPEYTPSDAGIYTLTAVSNLDTDQNILNDSLTIEFEVQPEFLPPAFLTTVNSQNGIVPLSWYEPGTPACSLIAYDGDVSVGCFYWGGYTFANEFACSPSAEVCSVFVRVASDSESDIRDGFWPNIPESFHDSIKVYVMGDDGSGMPVDTLADLTLTENYGGDGWISHAFDPPLVIESDKFWVGYKNIYEDGHYEAFVLDKYINHPEVQWYGDEGGVWYDSVYWFADYKIRASVRENGIDVTDDDLEILGYNIYRDTESGVEIGEETLLEENITDLSYTDETGIENGTTYYYIATVVYSDGENTIESAPSSEVSATPASGGELIASEESIEIEIQEGTIDTTQIILTNNGDLDVSFSTAVSTENELALAKTSGDNRTAISPEKSYVFLGTRENGYKLGEDVSSPPMTTGFTTPDEFGYVWIDSDEDNGPEYNWIDPTEHQEVDLVDGVSDQISLDFDFSFYGNVFNSIYISETGWISFTEYLCLDPWILPTGYAPSNMIAPYWSLLSVSRQESGIFFYTDNSKAVITWVDLSGGGPLEESYYYSYTFQLILYSDGRIVFQYNELDGDIYNGIVGIQNEDHTIATQVVCMSEYIYDGLATQLQVPWLRVEPSIGTVPANGSLTLDVISNSTGLTPDTYIGNIDIFSGDINGSLDDINVMVNMIRTDIEEDEDILPVDYNLLSNYPNPFNATTSIRFALSKADNVSLDVYDVTGRLARSLYSGELSAGTHSIVWDGTNQSGDKVSSGIYFYRLKTSDETRNSRMILLK